ncbi:hypothetical protein ABZ354_12170 [Streptomyces sp. NPDC005925]
MGETGREARNTVKRGFRLVRIEAENPQPQRPLFAGETIVFG